MQPKERLLRAIRGEEVDRTPWSPFLAYWWEAQPENVRGGDMLDFLEECGADPLLRGFGSTWKKFHHKVEKRETVRGSMREEVWYTPVGKLRFLYRYSDIGNTWFLVDHPVKVKEDLKTLAWVFEHTSVEYDPSVEEEYARIGNRGLIMPLIGSEVKTCFQSLVEHYVGTEQLTYLLADEPEEVEACLQTMRSVSDKTAKFCVQSPCEVFLFWEDSSTTNISPAMFKRYAMPEITSWGNELHSSGKLLIHHACGHIRALLPLMAQTPVDGIESISPPPTGNIDIGEAFSLLPDTIALIGGIEPTFFENCTMPELDSRVNELLAVSKGKRYILANSDSCPPLVSKEKLSRPIQQILKQT